MSFLNRLITNPQKALGKKTNRKTEELLDEISLKSVEATREELWQLQIETQRHEFEIQTLITKAVLFMSMFSLIAYLTFACYILYIGKPEEAKNMLSAAMNVTTHPATAVIAYYFGAKKQK